MHLGTTWIAIFIPVLKTIKWGRNVNWYYYSKLCPSNIEFRGKLPTPLPCLLGIYKDLVHFADSQHRFFFFFSDAVPVGRSIEDSDIYRRSCWASTLLRHQEMKWGKENCHDFKFSFSH